MTRLVLFTLAGPLMAFGDIAPGERRVGHDRPGRAALLGLIGAALGLRRDDERLRALAVALAFAVRVDAPGEALVDYHTTQTAPAKRKRHFATRREELAIAPKERVTILSQRAYRADAAFTIAVLPLEQEAFAAEAVVAALERPGLPIHAGRRSCPLALPPSPRLVEAADLAGAFAAYDAAENADPDRAALRGLCGIRGAVPATLIAEEVFVTQGLLAGPWISRRETRRDDPVDRVRWQFAPRTEVVAVLPEPAP